MSNRSDQANQKQAAALSGRSLIEQSDYCTGCGTETTLATMNLVTGECSACSKNSINKLKELLKKGLSDES